MATHFSILAWRLPWTEEPGGLQSQFSSVAQSCPTLCDPMDYSMSGLPDHHQLPEFTQTHVHIEIIVNSNFPIKQYGGGIKNGNM